MKKLVLTCFFGLVFPWMIFAQPKQMLSEQSIISFINNFETIMSSLEQYRDEISVLNSKIDGTGGVSIIQQAMALEVPAGIDKVFKDNGMGDNGYKKMFIISTGFSIIDLESAIQFGMSNTKDPKIQKEFQDNLNALNALKMDIHPSDMILIKAKKDILKPFFG